MNVKRFLSFAWSRPATYDLKVKNKSEYLQVLKTQFVVLQVKSGGEIFQRANEKYFCLFPKKQHFPIFKFGLKVTLCLQLGSKIEGWTRRLIVKIDLHRNLDLDLNWKQMKYSPK